LTNNSPYQVQADVGESVITVEIRRAQHRGTDARFVTAEANYPAEAMYGGLAR
jgi:hypothetical protein